MSFNVCSFRVDVGGFLAGGGVVVHHGVVSAGPGASAGSLIVAGDGRSDGPGGEVQPVRRVGVGAAGVVAQVGRLLWVRVPAA